MKRVIILLAAGTVLSGLAAFAASGQTAPAAEVTMWRLDCGTVQVNDLNRFSDINAYTGKSMAFTGSCYLIKHGTDYMLWDTGLSAAMKGLALSKTAPIAATLSTTIVEQLAKIGVKPADISRIGISHYHFDHTGQAGAFPQATLMIGKGDAESLGATPPQNGADPTPHKNWFGGTGQLEAVAGDKDVFGDGSVTMVDLPGHTPGHHGLLVKLAKRGNFLLSGDAAHFRENYDSNGVPGFNYNRADTLASLERFKGLAKNVPATVIIQHDPRDIAKLPAFPASAN